jgi:thiamine-phosphate pyrophosphorylase
MLLYYITDRGAFPGDELERRRRLVLKIGEAARAGVDYIQLREKDLSAGELEVLGREALAAVRGSGTRLLLNSRTDVALAAGADGVHLRGEDVSAREVAGIRDACGRGQREWVSGVSCHSVEDVRRAEVEGTGFAVLGPIFGKASVGIAAAGLEMLRIACRGAVPVLALGGVTVRNARSCVDVGAGGVAGIRLFQDGNIFETVRELRLL